MTHPDRTYDSTGYGLVKRGTHVMVIRNNHHRKKQTGTVVRVKNNRVWIAFPDGEVAPAGHRSIRVLT
jgi:hypothetical protein